jgi:hypothetical protein
MADNFERLKRGAGVVRRTMELSDPLAGEASGNTDARRLRSIFGSLVSARNDMMSSFESLLSLRVGVYGAAISAYTSAYYAWEISQNSSVIDSIFKVLEILESEEFLRRFDLAVYSLENATSTTDKELADTESYFGLKFDQIVEIAFPDGEAVEYDLSSGGLTVDGEAVGEEEKSFNKIYIMLELLGKLRRIREGSVQLSVSGYKGFINDPQTGFTLTLRENIAERANSIADIVMSNRFMEFYRSEKDESYKKKYTETLVSKFDKIRESYQEISDLEQNNIERMIFDGRYQAALKAVSEAASSSRDLLEESLESISVLENFVENYQPIIQLPTNQRSQLLKSVRVAEEASSMVGEYQDVIQISKFYDPFRELPGSRTITEFSRQVTGVRSADGSVSLNGSIYDMIILYIGESGREFLDESTSRYYSNYAVSNLLRKRLVLSSYLSESYRNSSALERSLFEESGVLVVRNPDEEVSTSPIQQVLSHTNLLDYIRIADALKITEFLEAEEELEGGNVENDEELSLRGSFRVIIMEGLGKIPKDQLDPSINRLLELFSSAPRDNLRSMYTEFCFKETVEAMVEYLEGIDEGELASRTMVSKSTLDAMRRYCRSDNPTITTLRRWLYRYASVHSSLYAGASIDLLSRAISNTELRGVIRPAEDEEED